MAQEAIKNTTKETDGDMMSTDHKEESLEKTHRYPTRQKNIENRPKATKRVYHNSFLVKGNRTYAKLPSNIREHTKIKNFIQAAKKHFIEH